MALGRQGERQADLMIGWAEPPRSPGTPSTTACRRSWSRPGSTAPPRRNAGPTTRRSGAARRCRRGRYFKGYHSREGLKDLEDGAWKSRIAEKKVAGVNRWRGDAEGRRAVYNNRARLRFGTAKKVFKLRAELVRRSFASTLDRGGMRRAWLRGGENLKKRYLVHVAGYDLGLIMRLLVGAGTPRKFLARASAHLLLLTTAEGATAAILVVATGTDAAILVVSIQPEPHDGSRVSSTRCYVRTGLAADGGGFRT